MMDGGNGGCQWWMSVYGSSGWMSVVVTPGTTTLTGGYGGRQWLVVVVGGRLQLVAVVGGAGEKFSKISFIKMR